MSAQREARKVAAEHGLALGPNRPRSWPIVEVFGPTIQGEGPDAGRPCWFVRFGGCDFRCSWCDSMHAVDPAQVRAAPRLTAQDVFTRLLRLGAWGRERPYVVLSGGNPALHHADSLIDMLVGCRATIAVETQGTVYRDWLDRVDQLIVSPKPPSSGMDTERHRRQLVRFVTRAAEYSREWPVRGLALKIVVADEGDYAYAARLHAMWPEVPFYLSVMTEQPNESWHPSDDDVRLTVADRYRWLCERAAADPAMDDVVVLPQLHVVAWGARAGV